MTFPVARTSGFARRNIPVALGLIFFLAMMLAACDIPGFSDDSETEPEVTPAVDDPASPVPEQDEPAPGQEPDDDQDVQHQVPDEAFQVDGVDGGQQASEPVRIVEGGLQEPRTLNPILVDDPLSEELSKLIFSGLTRIDPETGDAAPDLAESWDVDEAGTTYRFQLREGITWHDGQSVTAQDVAFTFELMMDQRTRSPRMSRIVERVVAVEAVSAQVVEFRLIAPYAPFASTIATFGIVPQHLLGNVLPDELVAEPFGVSTAVGAGPFTLVHWDRGERIVVEASATHYAVSPAFDRYEYRVAPDADALLDELERGEIDWAKIGANLFDEVSDLNDVEAISLPSFEMVSVVLQLDPGASSTFENASVRRALMHALDRDEMIQMIWNGQAAVAHSIIPSLSWAAAEPETRYPFDPGRAGELLDEAGWTTGDGGVRQRDGIPLQFTLIANGDNPIRRDLAEWLVAQWREVGVDASVTFETWSNVRERITTTRDFEALLLGYRWEVDPNQHAMWSSDSIADGFNLGSYVNRDVDQLLTEALSTTDQQTRAQLYAEAQELVLQDLPVLPLSFPDQLLAVGPRLQAEEQTAILLRNRANVAGWVPSDDNVDEEADEE